MVPLDVRRVSSALQVAAAAALTDRAASVDFAEQPDAHVYTVRCRAGAAAHELVFGDPPEHRVVEWRVTFSSV